MVTNSLVMRVAQRMVKLAVRRVRFSVPHLSCMLTLSAAHSLTDSRYARG